jgi:hypothetical protein
MEARFNILSKFSASSLDTAETASATMVDGDAFTGAAVATARARLASGWSRSTRSFNSVVGRFATLLML